MKMKLEREVLNWNRLHNHQTLHNEKRATSSIQHSGKDQCMKFDSRVTEPVCMSCPCGLLCLAMFRVLYSAVFFLCWHLYVCVCACSGSCQNIWPLSCIGVAVKMAKISLSFQSISLHRAELMEQTEQTEQTEQSRQSRLFSMSVAFKSIKPPVIPFSSLKFMLESILTLVMCLTFLLLCSLTGKIQINHLEADTGVGHPKVFLQ